MSEDEMFPEDIRPENIPSWGSGGPGANESREMIRKISISELKPGMSVVNTCLSWMDHPFLFSMPGPITTKRQVKAIHDAGYLEMFIQDPEAGAAFGDSFFRVREQGPGDQARTLPSPEDYAQAQALYEDSFTLVMDFTKAAKLGRPINRESVRLMLEGIVGSVTKNPDALVSLITLRTYDEYTYTHSINVAVLAMVFGRYLGLEALALRNLGEAGLYHDLGKIKVPGEILNKPACLSPEEFQLIKSHPLVGSEILERQGEFPEEVLQAVREHHEKFNGSGYPHGITGDRQCQMAQIISLADVYDALTSNRSYRKAINPNTAMRILFAMRDKDFPLDLVERFIKCLGIYPVGSLVRLKNGAVALVCGANPSAPLYPTVKIILDKSQFPRSTQTLDLSSPEANALGEDVAITGTVDPIGLGVDSLNFLF